MTLFYSQEAYDAHQDELFNEQFGETCEQSAMRLEAQQIADQEEEFANYEEALYLGHGSHVEARDNYLSDFNYKACIVQSQIDYRKEHGLPYDASVTHAIRGM